MIARHISVLNYLATVQFLVEYTDDKVTDEILLASIQQRLKPSHHVTKNRSHYISLVLRLQLLPEIKLFLNHIEVVLNVEECLISPHFVHRGRQV